MRYISRKLLKQSRKKFAIEVGENNKYSILDGFYFLNVTYDNCRLYRLLSSDFSYEISKLDE